MIISTSHVYRSFQSYLLSYLSLIYSVFFTILVFEFSKFLIILKNMAKYFSFTFFSSILSNHLFWFWNHLMTVNHITNFLIHSPNSFPLRFKFFRVTHFWICFQRSSTLQSDTFYISDRRFYGFFLYQLSI